MKRAKDLPFGDYSAAVEAAKRGDQEGFRFLYESTYRDKFFIARKYMKNDTDAADILQEAYFRAWQNLHTLKDAEKFPAWLSTIVANCALNALKKTKPMLFSEIEGADEEIADVPYDEEDLRAEYRPDLAFAMKEEARLIGKLIDALSDEQRLCILLFYVEELSVAEIASIIGCSRGTVLSRLNYGRKNLRKKAQELKIYKYFPK